MKRSGVVCLLCLLSLLASGETRAQEIVPVPDAPLPEVDLWEANQADTLFDPIVDGNRYTHPFYNFSLTLPNEEWQYITDPESIADYNEDALLVMNAPDLDLYSMVIVEKFPGMEIEDYAELVKPSLDSLQKKSGEAMSISGLPAYRQVWTGNFDGIPMHFHYTFLKKGEYWIQIVSWCARSNWSDGIENQFHSLGLNYTDLGPAKIVEEARWVPPPQIDPANTFVSEKRSFGITRPSDQWRFISERNELLEINPDATLVMSKDDEIFSMVIVERLPDLSLAEYMGKVAPMLDGALLVEEEEAEISGLEARRRHWRGKFDQIPFDFFYCLLAKGDDRIQVVSWCATSMVNENIRSQIRYIEESFHPVSLDSTFHGE